MALPNTGISITQIATAIGEASNDLGTLFCSDKVNEYGFNCPDSQVQNTIWGMPSTERIKLSPNNINFTPIAGYPMGYHQGAFRGYDHSWKVYTFEAFGGVGNEYYNPITFTLGIKTVLLKLESLPEPSPAVDHVFKVEFGRATTDFSQGTATVIYASLNVNYPSYSFQINANNPPDFATKGTLAIGQTFYIKLSHTSSPERRWVDPDVVTEIFSFVVPNTAYTNAKNLSNLNVVAVEQTTPTVYKNVNMSADLNADFGVAGSVTVKYEIATDSAFTTNYYASSTTVPVPKNVSNPGTPTLVDNIVMDFTDSPIFQQVAPGNTIYCRFLLNGVSQGVREAIVLDSVPL